MENLRNIGHEKHLQEAVILNRLGRHDPKDANGHMAMALRPVVKGSEDHVIKGRESRLLSPEEVRNF